jgi:hypothetical protein
MNCASALSKQGTMTKRFHHFRFSQAIAITAIIVLFVLDGVSADSSLQVVFDASKAMPRQVEALTERSILRDYKFAWANLAQALEFNSIAPLEGSFTGTANAWLNQAVASQQHSGLASRYRNQNHQLEAAFYAPEGDVIELHDTASYDLQVLDGSKMIHNEHVTVCYVVLMTPGADRWVVRQLQATPQF